MMMRFTNYSSFLPLFQLVGAIFDRPRRLMPHKIDSITVSFLLLMLQNSTFSYIMNDRMECPMDTMLNRWRRKQFENTKSNLLMERMSLGVI